MSVAEILEKVKSLTPQERKQLIKRLIDSMVEDQACIKDEDWDRMLDRLLVIFDKNDWQAFNVDNPTQWVNERKGTTNRPIKADDKNAVVRLPRTQKISALKT
jgi:hypothetical protein